MDSHGWKVLLVEDDFDSVQMVSKILTHHGAEVHVAGNGVECLEMLDQVNPDLVVMDLAMPEMGGWQTLMEIRADAHTSNIPVVAITAYDSVRVANNAAEVGFDAYFPKPINPASFIERLAEIIDT